MPGNLSKAMLMSSKLALVPIFILPEILYFLNHCGFSFTNKNTHSYTDADTHTCTCCSAVRKLGEKENRGLGDVYKG